MAEVKTTEPNPALTFEVGDQVRHPQFGIGTVLYKYGDGDQAKLDIVFAEEGQKKLLVKYAKLKKVTDPGTETPAAGSPPAPTP